MNVVEDVGPLSRRGTQLDWDVVRLLLVEDDRDVRKGIRRMLARAPDVEVHEAPTARAALEMVQGESFDLLLVDIRLSDKPDDRSGLELLHELRRMGRMPPSVIVTSSSAIADIREAMRLGARDYVLKDELCEEMFLPIVDSFRERLALSGEVQRLRQRVDESWGPAALLGSSAAMDRVRRTIQRVADADAPVLIRGETGTGKEMVAHAIHQASHRRNEPFVAVNCAAIPATLLESTLFGHDRGAFTGADRRRRGRLEVAGQGTVLLDEIADMPLELQSKLLRVLEEQRFLPIGAEREVPLRARIVAATNADLDAHMAKGAFRRDLFYRLNVVSVDLPPLRDRGDDVVELLAAFTESLPRRLEWAPEAVHALEKRRWDGNVRELRNVVERLSLLAEDDTIDARALGDLVPERAGNGGAARTSLDPLVDSLLATPDDGTPKVEALERALYSRALERTDGNKTAAARLLGLHRKSFERRVARLASPDDDGEDDD
jgi:two-component system response regulator HydG